MAPNRRGYHTFLNNPWHSMGQTMPKRFAWILGGTLGIVCLGMRLLHMDDFWIIGVLSICYVLTWLEAVLGFCVGCWMHSLFFECEVCEVPYRPGSSDGETNG
jgi:hypothetical protein